MIHRPNAQSRRGLSLLELLAVLTILAAIAAIILPRLSNGSRQANVTNCDVNESVIAVQVSLWQRQKGSWPNRQLTDIGSDPEFFPEGLPQCPVDGSPYTIDPATGRVRDHGHD